MVTALSTTDHSWWIGRLIQASPAVRYCRSLERWPPTAWSARSAAVLRRYRRRQGARAACSARLYGIGVVWLNTWRDVF